MTADNDLIEQIVANVLAELQPPPTVRAPIVAPVMQSPPKSESLTVDLDNSVITANLLAERVRSGQMVRIAARAILTPSARDWLAQRKIIWSRINGTLLESKSASNWQIVLTTVTPAVSTLRSTLVGWKTELLGTAKEAADAAVRLICTSEADGVFGLCGSAETVACLANRNPKVRAAVVHLAGELPELVSQLGPNLLIVNPQGKSFVELRNLVRAVESLSKPQVPSGM